MYMYMDSSNLIKFSMFYVLQGLKHKAISDTILRLDNASPCTARKKYARHCLGSFSNTYHPGTSVII